MTPAADVAGAEATERAAAPGAAITTRPLDRRARALARVFRAKLAVTALLWAGPLLLIPASRLVGAGVPAEAVPLARLLGWAYAALGVGYWFGLKEVRSGGQSTGAVVVGIVSNGGACALLSYFGATGRLASLSPLVQNAAWLSAALTFAITLGLYWYGLRRPAED